MWENEHFTHIKWINGHFTSGISYFSSLFKERVNFIK